MIPFSDTEIIIQETINRFFDDIDNIDWDHNSYWTRRIMTLLAELAISQQLLVACSKAHAIQGIHWGEWLYDMVWYEINKEDNIDGETLKDIHLVVESEWGSEYEVRRDFEKLIVARSRHRLMIFESNSLNNIQDIIDDLISIVKRCKLSQTGDRYMFAGYCKHEKRFDYQLHIV